MGAQVWPSLSLLRPAIGLATTRVVVPRFPAALLMAVDLSGGGPRVNFKVPGGDSGGGGGAAASSGAAPPSSNTGGAFSGITGGMTAAMAMAAMNDPAMQETASTHARNSVTYARQASMKAIAEFNRYIQEGPAGVSILCFAGGCATTIVGLLGLLNIIGGLSSPFKYLLNAYLTLFGIVTVLLEADVNTLANLSVAKFLAPRVEHYQEQVFERARFLTELRGRGFFYLFVGLLAVTQCFVCLLFLVGLWYLIMGLMCLAMSYGVNPAAQLASGDSQQDGAAPLFQHP
eukprot:NODE_598_length_1455_cov_355.027143.p1 GENE.NODE_598_length_1455_cov_355.027143~~NODE_598_length_1455_cov_355.027143.p1  ORF type:complete len:288 (+),score=75.19 NODE_598_length_1455_cov_355.027143:3-866(+)